jgi:peptide deformylase
MAVLRIRTFGDPVLRQRARPVEAITEVHRRLIGDMLETMRAAPGVGLAGNQVGVLERIFVWEIEADHGAVINPEIVARSEETAEDEEGCLSLPGLSYPLTRHHSVRVQGYDERGHPLSLEGSALLGRVFQHEIDHLDGVLFIDRLPDELRRQALRKLREQSLGVAGVARAPAPEEAL